MWTASRQLYDVDNGHCEQKRSNQSTVIAAEALLSLSSECT
jgi:hypothetical protein